jgi:hypothetical protein
MLVGCSVERRDYEVPSALCGVSVNREVVSDLLPSGDRIKIEEKHPVYRRSECQVNVDGKAALILSQEWWEDGDTIVDVAASVPQLESAKLTDDGGSYISTGTGAVMKVADCTSPDHPDHTLFTGLEVHSDDVSDDAAVKKLITSYTRTVADSDTCR